MTCPQSPNAGVTRLTDDQCDQIADAILRAAGSALKHYTMPKSRDDIRAAVRQSLSQVVEAKDGDQD